MDQRAKGMLLVAVNLLIVGFIAFAFLRGSHTALPPSPAAEGEGSGAAAERDPAGVLQERASQAPALSGAPMDTPEPAASAPRREGPTRVAAGEPLPAPATAPDAAQDRNALGVHLFNEQRYAEAARAFEEALAEAPAESTIRSNLAFALANSAVEKARSGERARVDEAIDLLDRALSLRPGTVDFQKARGEILFGAGALRESRQAFEDVALHEDDPIAERYLGEIAYREERLVEALRRWKRALQLGDPDPGLPERIAKVEREAGVESEMEISRGRHFAVKFAEGEAGSTGQAEVVLRSLERIRDRVEREYDAVPRGTISVILYSQEEFRGVTGAHAWAGGIYDGKIRVPLRGFAGAGEQAERLLAHEYAHALVAELGARRAPGWLDEGIAQKIAGEWGGAREGAAAIRLRDEGPIPFDSLETSFALIAERGAAERAYYQAYLAVDYLTRRYYTRDLRALLDALASGTSMKEALREVYHLTYEGLSRSLADEAAERSAGP